MSQVSLVAIFSSSLWCAIFRFGVVYLTFSALIRIVILYSPLRSVMCASHAFLGVCVDSRLFAIRDLFAIRSFALLRIMSNVEFQRKFDLRLEFCSDNQS